MAWTPSEPNAIQRLQIVYKIAERCNLNCTYCYYYNMGDASALARPALVSRASSAQLGAWLAQGCDELEIPEVLISFHGGEPMLMRAAAFAETCEGLIRAIEPVARLNFSIQTNGTLLTDGWLEALKRFQVNVGVSIDGRRTDHDRFRLDHHGRSSFSATEATLTRLIDASVDYPNLRPGTISVLHHQVDYAAAYRYLRGLGVRSMHFLLPDRNADQRDGIKAEATAIGRGLIDIFESWLIEDDPDVHVRFIDETIGYFEFGGTKVTEPRRRKSNQVLVARSDGTIAIDDSLIPAIDWYQAVPDFPIAQYSLRDVLSQPIFQLLEEEGNRLPDDCVGCPWTAVCGGGDLENRYSAKRGFNNRSVYCDTYMTLYRGLCDLLLRNGYPAPEMTRRFGELAYA